MKVTRILHDATEVGRFLFDKLDEYNSKFMQKNSDSVCLTIKNEYDLVIAGLLGEVYGLGLYISILWVDESERGNGLGKILIEKAEVIGLASGCSFITLDTFSFQAPSFYEKMGFEIFGMLDCDNGTTRFYLKKSLKKRTLK